MSKFITEFERATKLMIDMFCAKQEAEVEHIVKDDISGIYCIGDCYFNLSDIYYDMKENKPKGLIFAWQNHVTEWNLEHNSNCSINYDSYCMGARFDIAIYELNSDHIIYFKGQSVLLKKGDKFKLAGLKLSSFGNNSPFHYQDDIIRLPNSILKLV